MHRVITGAVQGQVVDHINDDGLDNQRSNLRIVTNAQNVANQRVRGTGSSIFRGVTWDVRTSKWMARINVDCKSIWLGRFSDENEAARVFDEAARKAWGEYARLNFPDR